MNRGEEDNKVKKGDVCIIDMLEVKEVKINRNSTRTNSDEVVREAGVRRVTAMKCL